MELGYAWMQTADRGPRHRCTARAVRQDGLETDASEEVLDLQASTERAFEQRSVRVDVWLQTYIDKTAVSEKLPLFFFFPVSCSHGR